MRSSSLAISRFALALSVIARLCVLAVSGADGPLAWRRQNALDPVEEEERVLGANADRGRSVNRLGNSVRFGSSNGLPNGNGHKHEHTNGYH